MTEPPASAPIAHTAELLAAVEAVRVARKTSKKAFWAYADACTAHQDDLAASLDRARDKTSQVADAAMAKLMEILDRA